MPVSAIKTTVSQNYRRLNQHLAAFVPRREQNYLVAEIVKTLCGEQGGEHRLLIAEAGTGIGKSLAYLQGAIPAAMLQNKRLVLSTATLSLQEQLINKDLPLFAQISEQPVRYRLVKGRQRYCCIVRLQQLVNQQQAPLEQLSFSELLAFKPDAAQQALFQAMLNAWQAGSWQGDRDSWPETIADTLWDLVSCQSHSCTPLFPDHQDCPFHKARRDLETQDVLVVNHALLLADLGLGGGVILPPPEECFYVIDEAHHLPTIARDQAAAVSSLRQDQLWLQKMPHIGDELTKTMQNSVVSRCCDQLNDQVQLLLADYKQLQQLFKAQRDWFATDTAYRFEHGELPSALHALLSGSHEPLRQMARLLDRLQGQLAEQARESGRFNRQQEALMSELAAAQLRTQHLVELWDLLLVSGERRPVAKWLEYPGAKEYVLHAAPLEMAGWLKHHLWSRCAGAIVVSATLTALNRFDYFCHQAGIHAEDQAQLLRLKSPFDYQRAELLIPQMPCEPADPAFTHALIEQLPRYLAQQQASLILFASYWQMQEVATGLRNQGWSLLVQGEASRQALLALHRERCAHGTPSILLGTGSFSEGLDLPGEQLTNLIITKLPFAVPDSPIEAAMAEAVSRRGGNPFLQITVPEASRKLIQACGRLIRQEQDAGRIVLLDRRIVTRQYGRSLLQALPPFRCTIE